MQFAHKLFHESLMKANEDKETDVKKLDVVIEKIVLSEKLVIAITSCVKKTLTS